MNDSSSFPRLRRIPVPPLFWSAYHEAPFRHCIDCGGPLLEADCHFIQRAFVGNQPVFELAICRRCHEHLLEQFSRQTCQAMDEHLMNCCADRPVDESDRISDEQLLTACVDCCLICGRNRSECHRFCVGGACAAGDLLLQAGTFIRSPVMICDRCLSDMSDLISTQTRDAWDRFVEQHFDGPPAVGQDVPDRTPLLI